MARNQFQFGKSDLFDRGQFNDLYRATVTGQLKNLRNTRDRIRRNRGVERANFRSLGNQFRDRMRDQASDREQIRDRGIEQVAQSQGAFDERTQRNLGFLSDIFGRGTENRQLDSADDATRAQFDAAQRALATNIERSDEAASEAAADRMAFATAQENQARAEAFNAFLNQMNELGSQVDLIKRQRPLFAQQIREQLENRGIALEELGMAQEGLNLERDRLNEQKRQFDASNMLNIRQAKAANKAQRAELRNGYGQIMSALLSGKERNIKVPRHDMQGSMEITVPGRDPKSMTRRELLNDALNLGVPRRIATESIGRFWENRGIGILRQASVTPFVGKLFDTILKEL